MFGFVILLVYFSFCSLNIQPYTIKGFRYEDNKAIFKWVEGMNGHALTNINAYFPMQLSVCFRGFPEWNRHGHRTNWVDFKLNIPDLRTENKFEAE